MHFQQFTAAANNLWQKRVISIFATVYAVDVEVTNYHDYLDVPCITDNCDLLEYWEGHEEQYQHLTTVPEPCLDIA